QRDLRAFRKLADNVEKHVCGHGGRAARGDLSSDGVDDFDIKVSGLQRKFGAVAVQKHIGEDRNRVAALDHTMNVAQTLQQFRTFNGDFHRRIQKASRNATIRVTRREAFGKPGPAGPRGFSMSFYGFAGLWACGTASHQSSLSPAAGA